MADESVELTVSSPSGMPTTMSFPRPPKISTSSVFDHGNKGLPSSPGGGITMPSHFPTNHQHNHDKSPLASPLAGKKLPPALFSTTHSQNHPSATGTSASPKNGATTPRSYSPAASPAHKNSGSPRMPPSPSSSHGGASPRFVVPRNKDREDERDWLAKIKDRVATLSFGRGEEIVRDIEDLCAGLSFLKHLPPKICSEFYRHVKYKCFPPDTLVFDKGDAGDACYIVLSRAGALVLEDAEGEVIETVGQGEILGELALLNGAPRAAAVRSPKEDELHVLWLSIEDYKSILWHHHIKTLKSTPKWSIKLNQCCSKPPNRRNDADVMIIQQTVSGVKFFMEMTDSLQKRCCRYLRYAKKKAGETVFQQGSVGDLFYVVQSGSVEVRIQSATGGNEMVVAKIAAGGAFGELALLNDAARAATVRCVEDCEFLTLSKDAYDLILKKQQLSEVMDKVLWIKKLFPAVNGQLSKRSLHLMSTVFRSLRNQPGDIIANTGDPLLALKFVVHGKVSLFLDVEMYCAQPWRTGTAADTTTQSYVCGIRRLDALGSRLESGWADPEEAAFRMKKNERKRMKIKIGTFGPGMCVGAQELFAPGKPWKNHCYIAVADDSVILGEVSIPLWTRQVPRYVRHEQFGKTLQQHTIIRKGLEDGLLQQSAAGWVPVSDVFIPLLIPLPGDGYRGALNNIRAKDEQIPEVVEAHQIPKYFSQIPEPKKQTIKSKVQLETADSDAGLPQSYPASSTLVGIKFGEITSPGSALSKIAAAKAKAAASPRSNAKTEAAAMTPSPLARNRAAITPRMSSKPNTASSPTTSTTLDDSDLSLGDLSQWFAHGSHEGSLKRAHSLHDGRNAVAVMTSPRSTASFNFSEPIPPPSMRSARSPYRVHTVRLTESPRQRESSSATDNSVLSSQDKAAVKAVLKKLALSILNGSYNPGNLPVIPGVDVNDFAESVQRSLMYSRP